MTQSVAVAHGSDDEKSSSKKPLVLDLLMIKSAFQAIFSQVKGRVSLETVRSLPMFMGITDQSYWFTAGAYTPPIKKIDKFSVEKIKSRIKLNFAFFISNYALVCSMVALVVSLMHAGMILWLLSLWGGWTFHTFLISNEVVIGGRNIGTLVSIKKRSTALWIISFVIVVSKCFKPAIEVVSLSSILILGHALFRDPNHVETSGGFHFKDSSDDESGGSGSRESEVLVEHEAP